MKSNSWVGGFHKVLADEESSEAGFSQSINCTGIRDTALADENRPSVDRTVGLCGGTELLSEAEGVLDIGVERTEVAVVDAAHVGS